MLDKPTVKAYLMTFAGVEIGHPYGQEVDVYTVAGHPFALLSVGKLPLQLHLRCDPQLAQVLRDKYESVLPAKQLDQKQWNTVILSGQLSWEEVQDLIRHSYILASSQA